VTRRPYAFTDPLGASDSAGTRRRIRHAHALIHGAGAVSLVLAFLNVDGPVAQHAVVAAAAAITAFNAVLALVWKRVPDFLLVAAFPLAAVVVTAIAVLDPPLALTPMYYVWPLMSAAYFLGRRALLVTYGTVVLSFAAAIPWIEPRPTPIQWLTVAIVGGVVVFFVRRLTRALERQARALGVLAREDPLTGALNRRALVERLEQELARARRSGTGPAVAVLDVDHFKEINDRFGHAGGDAALRGLVTAIGDRLRAGDALGRIGGEEFAVMLGGTDAPAATVYADELRVLVGASAAATGTPFTISVGVAASAHGHEDAEALLAAADAALYAAKRAGRDTVRAA
jgi:diguanylate cyclase (GGDEF)-like protein